jgi:hypothetical protein
MDSGPTLDDLVKRWHPRRQQGETLSLHELCAEAPDRVDELRQYLQAVAAMASFLSLNGTGTDSTLFRGLSPADGAESEAAGAAARPRRA